MHFSIYVLLILMCVIYLADHHFIMKNDVNIHFLCAKGVVLVRLLLFHLL